MGEQGSRFMNFEVEDDKASARYEAEIQAVIAAVKKNPEDGKSWLRQGELQLQKQKFSDAIHSFEHAIRNGQNTHEAYFLLGNCYLNFNEFEMAARYYIKGLRINPDHTPTLFNAGFCYLRLGINDKAISAFKKFYALEKTTEWKEEARFQLFKLGLKI